LNGRLSIPTPSPSRRSAVARASRRSFTHNRYYRSQKLFADAIFAFMRETIPREWENFRDTVSDNFRVITHENFRVF
jgi:hypothetical protein